MGLTVVVDNTLCYLISNKDDEVFAFPRKIMEPELRALRPQINHLGFALQDEEACHYISSAPWGGYLKTKKPSFKTCEEQVRLLIVKKINQVNCLSAIYLKTDFEKADSLWSDPSNVTTPDSRLPTISTLHITAQNNLLISWRHFAGFQRHLK
jgi:hypothetical protein